MKFLLIICLFLIGCSDKPTTKITKPTKEEKPEFLDLRHTQKEIKVDLDFDTILTKEELERIPNIRVKATQEFKNSIVNEYIYKIYNSEISIYRNNIKYTTKTKPIFYSSPEKSILIVKLTLVNGDTHYYRWGHNYGYQPTIKFRDLKTGNETTIKNEHIIKYEMINPQRKVEYASKEDEEICKKLNKHNDIVRKAFYQKIDELSK